MRSTRLIRVNITAVNGAAGARARFSGRGRPGESFSLRAMMQQYGLASRPKAGAQGLVLKDGEQSILICTEDAQYRIALEAGEVAIYDDLGSKVHLRRNGVIELKASLKVLIDAPMVDMTGNLKVTGDIISEANVYGKLEIKAGPAATKLTTHLHTSGGPGSPTTPPTPGT